MRIGSQREKLLKLFVFDDFLEKTGRQVEFARFKATRPNFLSDALRFFSKDSLYKRQFNPAAVFQFHGIVQPLPILRSGLH